MRQPRPEWVKTIQDLCGAGADIRFNEAIHRWEFLIPCGDGVARSQFWGWFNQPIDVTTGLHPFRDLDDDGMRIAIQNLTTSFVGNRHDGAGTPRKEIESRMRFNRDLQESKYKEAGEAFADMAAERGHRIRGALLLPVTADITQADG